MTETPSPVPPARRRWIRIALVTSLAVNLLIVGLVAGAFLGDGPRARNPDRAPESRDLALGPYFDALPAADRRALVAAMRRESEALRENRAAIRRQFEALLAALRADPYDGAAVQTLIGAQQTKLGERQALGRRLLLELLEAMSPDGRAAYSDRLDRYLRRPPPDRRP